MLNLLKKSDKALINIIPVRICFGQGRLQESEKEEDRVLKLIRELETVEKKTGNYIHLQRPERELLAFLDLKKAEKKKKRYTEGRLRWLNNKIEEKRQQVEQNLESLEKRVAQIEQGDHPEVTQELEKGEADRDDKS